MKPHILALALACAACPPSPVVPQPDADSATPDPAPITDAAPLVDVLPKPLKDALAPTTLCGRACSQLAFLGCDEGAPTPAGESCESVCLRANAFPDIKLDVACAMKAQSIVAVRKCRGIRCGD